jgi:hypothetical protein
MVPNIGRVLATALAAYRSSLLRLTLRCSASLGKVSPAEASLRIAKALDDARKLAQTERPLQTLIIATFVPKHRWYRAALFMSRLEAFRALILRKGYPGKRGQPHRLHRWITELTPFGAFEIPLRVAGLPALDSAKSASRCVLLCSTHVPLYDLILPALAQSGFPPDLVVAAATGLSSAGRFPIPGADGGTAGVAAGPHALLRVRTTLRNGGIVMCLLDRVIEGPLYGNVLHLAGRLDAVVFFWSVALAADGVIEVGIEAPPFPLCEADEAVRRNLAAAERYRASVAPSRSR